MDERNYSAKIITIYGTGILTFLRAMKKLEKYRRSDSGIGAIALQPHPLIEDYVRAKLKEKSDDLDIWKTGHYIILIKYSLIKDCPLFCINKKTFQEDIKTIEDYLKTAENNGLAAVVNRKDKNFFKKEFLNYSFSLS
ncbi:hypothetical protein KY342_03835 [Candidatus Woesearchaeota archaeon]|nr:hypothetical protein [Candidatus Woesearchaeota archaeon]